MSNSAQAYIWFGFTIEKSETPWGERDYENWYYNELLGYKPPFKLWGDNDKYLPEIEALSKEEKTNKIGAYYNHKHEFIKLNPIPFEVVHLGHYDYDDGKIGIYIPKTIVGADWEAIPINVNTLQTPKKSTEFIKFTLQHFPTIKESDIQWYLSAYYG
jgi:hypothetical protein